MQYKTKLNNRIVQR